VAKQSTHQPARALYRDPRLLVALSISAVAVMGTSSVTPALPEIARVYQISSDQVGFMVAALMLPGVILTPILGLLGDRHGRKTILVPALILFGVAGGACAFAPNYEWLLSLRFIQGVGAAALSALTAASISDFFTGSDRAHALGYNAGVISIGAAIYPIIGGALTLLSWHYTFLLSVAALPVAALVAWCLPPAKVAAREALGDYLRRLGRAVANRQVALVLLASFMTFIVIYGVLITYLPFFLERDFHATPLGYGLVMAANALAGGVTSIGVGRLLQRFKARTVLGVAFTVSAIAVTSVPFLGSITLVVIAVIVLGSAQLQVLAIAQIMLTELVPAAQSGAIIAVNSMMFRLGQTVGPTFMGLVLSLWGLDMVFVVAGVLTLLVAPLCALVAVNSRAT
jgi:MFS transporter, ACDE family, multidrug resistance protein